MSFIRDHSPDEKLFRSLLKGLTFQRIQNPGGKALVFAEWIDARVFDYSRISELSADYSSVWTTKDEDFCRRQHDPPQWVDWLQALHHRFTERLLLLLKEKAESIQDRLPKDADLSALFAGLQQKDADAVSAFLVRTDREYNQAIRLFIQEYHRKCLDHVRRNSSQDPEADAKDLLTILLEKFLKQIGEGRYTGPSKAKLSVYLHPILVNSWNDEYLRRKKRESQLPAGPAYEWPAPDKAAYVKAGVERLKEPCQGIIRSRNIEDLPWKDVALRCDLTEGYVKTKHKECLEALRTILDNPRF
jgi:DNA-directed RNA polymerase specialized sigma24 family protein